ncbi:MAG: hypothetical protein ACFNZW_08755 [Coriobacteriaceae bacterium]
MEPHESSNVCLNNYSFTMDVAVYLSRLLGNRYSLTFTAGGVNHVAD